jgi:transcriptional regulator with XRE-family HTH domain
MTTQDTRGSGPNPLQVWRKRNRVTQAQLAAGLQVHPTVVSQWEQRRCKPTLQTFSRLVQYTRLPMPPLLKFFVRPPTGSREPGVSGCPVGISKQSKTSS